jgi:hypothetical protein
MASQEFQEDKELTAQQDKQAILVHKGRQVRQSSSQLKTALTENPVPQVKRERTARQVQRARREHKGLWGLLFYQKYRKATSR